MADRIYDRLPFEVAQVLLTVERWHDHECNGLSACADSDLTLLAESAKELAAWKARQPPTARVPLVSHDSATHRLFEQRKRFTDKDRPKLRIVPVDEPSGD